MNSWYYLEKKRPVGPVTLSQLWELYKSGEINDQTHVAREGSDSWVPLSAAFEEMKDELNPKPHWRLESMHATRGLGIALFLIGFCALAFFLVFFHTSVEGRGGSVNNIGLLNDRQCGVNAGGFLMLAGAVLMAAGGEWKMSRKK